MTTHQKDLMRQIEAQRLLLKAFPDDLVAQVTLDTLYEAFRRTFQIINSPEYVSSPSRAELKRVQ